MSIKKLVIGLAVIAMVFAVAAPAKAVTIEELTATIAQLQASLLALQGGTTAPAAAHTYNVDLTVGSTGADVVALQTFLVGKGLLVMPAGVSMGYFGPATKAAVVKYQASVALPATGYVGPMTRANLNSLVVVPPTTGGNTGGTTGGTTALSGTAGDIAVTQTSTDVEDEVLTGDTGNVLGFKVQASGSDVNVTNIRVKFTSAVGSSASDRLTSYADKIVILADGKEVGAVDAADFVRDSAGVYSATIPVSTVVRMGSANKVTFHVGLKAVSSIDSDDKGSTNDWTVLLVSTRYEDASGVVITDSTASISNAGVYVDRVSSSSDVKLRMAEGSGNPKTSNVKISTSGSTDVTLAEFTLRADGSAMYFDQLRASTTITGDDNVSDMVSDFYLMRGSSRLAEVAGSTGTSQALTFALDDTENIAEGDTETYKIVAKVKAISAGTSGTAFDQGDTITASTSVAVWNINAKADSDGKSVTERAGSVTTYTQTFFSEGIQVAKVGENFTLLPNDTAANVAGEFKVTLRFTNLGSDDVYVPLNALASTTAAASGDNSTKGIAFYITDGTTATSTDATATLTGSVAKSGSGGVEKTNSVLISGGASADLVLTTSFNPGTQYSGTRQYRVQIVEVGHAATDTATATSFISTLPLEDFRTSYQTIQN